MNEKISDIGNALQSVLRVNGDDLLPGAGLFHISYTIGTTGSLDYLEVWASTVRGHWDLACRYWMFPAGEQIAGIRFEPGYASQGVARNLEFVMQHQKVFVPIASPISPGLLQVQMPLHADEKANAMTALAAALERSSR